MGKAASRIVSGNTTATAATATAHLELLKATESTKQMMSFDFNVFHELIRDIVSNSESEADGLPNEEDVMDIACNKQYSLSHCHKSHHHSNLIHVSELKLEHLPCGYQDYGLLKYIKCFAPFVVKITVREISPQRKHFPLSGKSMLRQGTGWLGQVHEDDIPERIPCPFCADGDGLHEVYGPIYVMTSRHLVYDEMEALSTEFVFTDDTSLDDSIPVWTAKGYGVAFTPDEDRDFIYIKCYSHQSDIFSHLKSITNVFNKAMMNLGESSLQNSCEKRALFVISHPHGRGKHISFGTVEDVEEIDVEFDAKTGNKLRGRLRYKYDVPSCPGSSGAAVCIMGMDGANYYQFPHSIDFRKRKAMNSGSIDWFND